jgi:hypothetical protein
MKFHVMLSAIAFLSSSLFLAGQAPSSLESPQDISVSGSGTTNYVPLWTSNTALGNSKLFQKGDNVGVGTTNPNTRLDVSGYVNSSKGYKLQGANFLTAPGGIYNGNVSLGYRALSNAPGGSGAQTAVGYGALENSGLANNNTAVGIYALNQNDTGSYNTAIGRVSLFNNTSGITNIAVGEGTLYYNTTGSGNIALGFEAGENNSPGNSNNVDIGNVGASADNGAIRIGTSGMQTSFYAAGVHGVSSGGRNAIPVLVDSNGQLVTISSSQRFKQDIQDMGDASRDLMRLRPVTFRYKKPLDDGSQPVQYGLIAEEVAKVYPDLIAYSTDGQVQTIKYQLLDPMLLNEVQRQHGEIQDLQEQLNRLKATLASIPGLPTTR